MKRLILIPLLLLLGLLPARAQQRPHEINLSLGFMPAIYNQADTRYEDHGDLYSLYEPRLRAEGAPMVGVDYNYALLPWLKVGVALNWTRLSGTIYKPNLHRETGTFRQDAFYLLPQVKAFYVNLDHFKMYAKAGAGLNINIGSEYTPLAAFAYDLAPVGLQWAGQRVYGMAELTYGNVVQGVRLGLGFRF